MEHPLHEIKKREVIKMRTIWYAILDTNTNEKTHVGVSGTRANKKLAEMQEANPDKNYRIIHKWVSL